jgi:hypothetical protein
MLGWFCWTELHCLGRWTSGNGVYGVFACCFVLVLLAELNDLGHWTRVTEFMASLFAVLYWFCWQN